MLTYAYICIYMCVRESVTRGFDELRYNESQGFIQKKSPCTPYSNAMPLDERTLLEHSGK